MPATAVSLFASCTAHFCVNSYNIFLEASGGNVCSEEQKVFYMLSVKRAFVVF